MYKDKDKQKEVKVTTLLGLAIRDRQRRYKARQKALLSEGVTDKALPPLSGYQENYEIQAHKPVTLHPAIIRTINRLTTNKDGTVDEQARTNRMAMAVNYERMFPGRPYTGVGL